MGHCNISVWCVDCKTSSDECSLCRVKSDDSCPSHHTGESPRLISRSKYDELIEVQYRLIHASHYKPKKIVPKFGSLEAMQFETNNQIGSPNLDAITNWINQGQMMVLAWHNGTDLFVQSAKLDGFNRAQVGDWVVKEGPMNYKVMSQKEFDEVYIIEGVR